MENQTVILHVSGDDYSALNFEEYFDSPQEVYEQMIKEGIKSKTFQSSDYYIEVKIKEFEMVDRKFFDFVKYDLTDYDPRSMKPSILSKLKLNK